MASEQVEEAVGNFHGDPHTGFTSHDEAKRDQRSSVEDQEIAGRIRFDPLHGPEEPSGGVLDPSTDQLVDPQCVRIVERRGEQLNAPDPLGILDARQAFEGDDESTLVSRRAEHLQTSAVFCVEYRSGSHPLGTVGGERDDHVPTESMRFHDVPDLQHRSPWHRPRPGRTL
jgi:hypothetical protein